jgi:hypothetical protein
MAFALFAFAPVAFAQDRDCKDYSSREAAQAELDANPSDRYNLDADNDGLACENYDYNGIGGGASPNPTPSPVNGGGTGGSGGGTDQPEQMMPGTGAADNIAGVALAALALLGAGSLVLAGTRRRA